MFSWCRKKRAVQPIQNHAERPKQILLLGAGETGKTTISKNLCYLYGKMYESEDKKLQFRNFIHENIISGMAKLIQNSNVLSSDLNKHANIVLAKNHFGELKPEEADHMKKLWQSEPIQLQWENHRQELQLPDGLCQLFKRIHIICQPSYVPTHEDILSVRKRTTGIIEATIKVEGKPYTIIDVGGQRNERRKWLHAFEDADCIIFVAALTNFCQSMFEDPSKNRLEDSLELFDKIIHQDVFKKKDICLFLNKKDIFQEMMKKMDLHDYYDDYKGAAYSFAEGSNFFTDMFLSKNKSSERNVYIFHTNAMSITCVQDVFTSIIERLEKNGKQ